MASIFSVIQAHAVVLTFDDIGSPSEGYDRIPDGYGGLNWGNLLDGGAFYYIDAPTMFPDSGFNNGRVSGDYIAYCTSYGPAGTGKITGSTFTFEGAYLTSGWYDDLNVQVEGYFNDSLIYTSTVTIDTTGPTWCEFNYANIDELRFSSFGGTVHEGYPDYDRYFAVDNFTYIPEPSSIAFLSLGFYILRRLPSRLKRRNK